MQGKLARPVWGWGPGAIPGPTPLFFGSDAGGHRAAVIYSLVASCKLCGIDPFAYLRDTIQQVCVPSFDQFADLTPAAWKAARQTHPES